MFDVVGVTVDVARCDIGVSDQIDFPESVVAHYPRRLGLATLGQCQRVVRGETQVTAPGGPPQLAVELARCPGPRPHQRRARHPHVRVITEVCLVPLVHGAKQMLVGHGAA